MRSRRSPWSVGLLAAGFALSLAAVGCGDDDTTDTGGSGGSGGSSGKSGSGGAAGKTGGTGGSAGKSGSGGTGGAVSASQCISDTTDVMKGAADALSAECISCACNADAKSFEACNGVAECWQFIACYDAHNCDVDQSNCVMTYCLDLYTKSSTQATAVGKVLQGSCASKCAVSGADAGTQDAGN